MEFDVTIELPRGTRNKYEMDRRTGRIRLDWTLCTATQYPADYGFIEDTRGGWTRERPLIDRFRADRSTPQAGRQAPFC
ncbi:hypothetical protein GCM10010170_010490 [Dactylosporangium salmoneum]|uniref:inorganic diphosphatase n=1 Tax=Dactylosporangium salmoneum TaxID=53361 RepID=A0ABN3FJW4_9ACTN